MKIKKLITGIVSIMMIFTSVAGNLSNVSAANVTSVIAESSEIKTGESTNVTVDAVIPEEAEIISYQWSSDNEAVAIVSGESDTATVQGLTAGKAKIKAVVNYEVKNDTEETAEVEETNDNEYVSGKMIDKNLLEAKDIYRKEKGLLTSNEIKQIRKKYGLTQAEFSFLLGLGEITITRYEKKLIQDETYDKIMRLVYEDSLLALDYLKENKDKFKNEQRYEKIEENIKRIVVQDAEEYFNKKELMSKYVNFENKNTMNGFKNIDIPKLEAVINYIANKNKKLYKVKLMKLLWYIDMLYYKKYGKSLTGLVYIHQKLGALPVGFEELMKLKSIDVKEEVKDESTIYHILPNNDYKVEKLSKQEKDVIDTIINKFKDFNTNQIVEYMHNEKVYKETNQTQVIDYSYAKNMNI